MSKKNIKPGYQLHVRSWENDGDNYKTSIESGLTKDEAQMMILLASAFDSAHYPKKDRPYLLCGNDENASVELLNLWLHAKDKHPETAAKWWPEEDVLPTVEQLELYDEFSALRYNDAGKNDPKFENLKEAENFVEFIGEHLRGMLGYPGEGYWDFHNFFRVCEGIQVYYVPAAIENVTNQFIDKQGNLI